MNNTRQFFQCVTASLLLLILWALPIHAEVTQQVIGTLKLAHSPLDIEISLSGKQIYVLDDQAELLIFNTSGQMIDRMKVNPDVDQVKIGPRDDILFLSSRKARTIQVVELTFTYAIETSQSPFKGPADAPVTIVVFSDFQCPYCARIGPIIERVRKLHPKRIKEVYKFFPLTSHRYSHLAAQAAVAAAAQGKFWEFHDLLFQNYSRLNEQKIDDIRASLHLDKAEFDKVMNSPATIARVNKDKQEGEDIGVRGTPTVFVNGQMVRPATMEGIEAAVEEALKSK